MKPKKYSVFVDGIKRKTYRITAKSGLAARIEAEKKFKEEFGKCWDDIESMAIADLHRKEMKG